MIIKKLTVTSPAFPEALHQMEKPPRQIYVTGVPLEGLMRRPRIAIVGSRKITPYGRQVTARLAKELAEQGVVIISGLAIGVDAVAHQAALETGGPALAVLPSPIEKIVPVTNRPLAKRILEQGGALVSEYEEGEEPFKQNFIARNRLVAGLADAVLITEAGEKSGSLHTARFTLQQGKDVLAVPGNITSQASVGTNNLIKAGAIPVTSYADVLHVLGLTGHQTAVREIRGRNAHEQVILDLLLGGIGDGAQLLERSGLPVSEFSKVLTMLEIGGKIRPLGANHWSLH
jgi:DNA processing protein